MAKTGHNRRNEIDDLIMLDDSGRGTLRATHTNMNSVKNFPSAQYETMNHCPISNPKTLMETRNLRSKRKLRSNSPCLNRSKTYRAASANDPYRGHIYAPRQGQGTIKHHVANSEYYPAGYQVNVEKTLSCPANLYGPEPYNPHSFTSQNSVQMEQFSENLFNIDEVVNKLKDEIERVKHQLRHLSQQRLENDRRTKIPSLAKTPPSTPEDREEIHSKEETQVTVMKNENRRLKHEIEVTRKLLEKSRVKVLKIKDILADYEKKVNLLQLQALKSSKAVKKSEETFCLCLKDKDTKIKTLKATNDILEQTVKDKTCLLNEKNEEMNKLNESINSLKQAFEETTTRCSLLNEINQNFLLSIDILRAELNNSASEVEKQKETIQNQEQKICDLNCVYNEMVARTSKRKDSSKLLINNNFQEQEKKTRQTSPLSIPVEEAEKQKTIMCKFPELEETVKEYEAFSVQCKDLEGNCKDVHEKFLLSENNFNKQKRDMSRLIGELTEIVKEYKVTISQISEINKQQEIIINNQGMALSTKEVELILIKKESHSFKNKSRLLEQEVEDLKRDLSDVCSEEASLSIYKELEELKKALNIEKDNQLIKDKIIQDQCETILNLQSQVKQKFQELTQALDVNQYLQREIDKINENLMMKHEELGLEIDENRSLIEKLRILEYQKSQLSEETRNFEAILQNLIQKYRENKKQKALLKNLEEEISEQKREWDWQKHSLGQEKDIAVCAAKFATQKLIDTLENFRRHMNIQKKVQLLLIKMLYEKDNQLRFIQSKVCSINNTKKIFQPRELLLNNIAKQKLFFQKPFELTSSASNPNKNISSFSNSNIKPECAVWRCHGKYFRIDSKACAKSG